MKTEKQKSTIVLAVFILGLLILYTYFAFRSQRWNIPIVLLPFTVALISTAISVIYSKYEQSNHPPEVKRKWHIIMLFNTLIMMSLSTLAWYMMRDAASFLLEIIMWGFIILYALQTLTVIRKMR